MKSVHKMLVYSGLIILVMIILSVFVILAFTPDLPVFIWIRDFLEVNLLTILGTVLLGLIKGIPRLVNYFNESEKQKIANRKRKGEYFQLGVQWARLQSLPLDPSERNKLRRMVINLNLRDIPDKELNDLLKDFNVPTFWFILENDKDCFRVGILVFAVFLLCKDSDFPGSMRTRNGFIKAVDELRILFKKVHFNQKILEEYITKIDRSVPIPNAFEVASVAFTELVEQLLHESHKT